MGSAVPQPGARNKKAPARFLSGRTSAMVGACVKGGSVVNLLLGSDFDRVRTSEAGTTDSVVEADH